MLVKPHKPENKLKFINEYNIPCKNSKLITSNNQFTRLGEFENLEQGKRNSFVGG